MLDRGLAAAMTAIGSITVQVAPAKPAAEGQPAVSGVYRNKASAEALPETYSGCSTLYELFNKSVELYGGNR